MNIYIYGSTSFKKEINKLLSKANVVFKLEDSGTISQITSVEELKTTIVQSPRDIFLIDENKIIKKGGVDFLKPKDGIERTFLNQYGVGDLSVDTFDDLVEHINARIELQKSQNDEEKTSIKSIDIDNLELKQNITDDEEMLNVDEIDDLSIDDDLDDTSNTISANDIEENDIEDSINIDDITEDILEEDDDIIQDDIVDIDETKEENMADDISDFDDLDDLDGLDESMLMDALDDQDFDSSDLIIDDTIDIEQHEETLTLDANQLGALTEVLSKLLNGKELQITIKVK